MPSLMNVSKGVSSAAPAAKDGSFCPSHERRLMLKSHHWGALVIATTPANAID
jgi:hypothetical protein